MIQINEVFKSGGDSFLSSVTKMLNCILKEKRTPEQWENGKILNNYRGIFLTNILSKIFEKIVYSRMYNNISNYISPFQVGSKKNQRTNDNMFLLRGAIDHPLYTNSPLTIIFYDFQDSFKTACYANGMLTYKMNCFI